MDNKTQKIVQVINPTKLLYSDKRKRAAAYCRVSTDSEDQVNSFVAQVKYYTDFIKHNKNMILVDIYADEGITGTCMNKRPEFTRMIKDSKAGKIDKIYVKSVSRFARNSLECLETVRLLKTCGTSVFFENDGIDTEKMNSEMILYIKSAFAQNEALACSRRMTSAIQMRMKNGDFLVHVAPYGFTVKDDKLVPVPEKKPIIERIYNDYLSGMGMGMIAADLNKSGDMDKRWTVSAVRYILNNEKYVGDSLLQKTYTPQILPLKNRPNNGEIDKYYVSNSHEAVIDHQLFNAVKNKLALNKLKQTKRAESKVYFFTKRIKCGDCGCSYKRIDRHGEIYWVCSSNGIAGRHYTTLNIKERDIQRCFVRLYNKIKQYEHETVDYILNQLILFKTKIYSQNTTINDIDVEIASICDRNNMLARLKARNIIDDVSYMEQTSEIQHRLTELRNRRVKLINEDEDEARIEEVRKLKMNIDSNGYQLLFDKTLFNETVSEMKVLNTGCIEFELKCGLKLKELI